MTALVPFTRNAALVAPAASLTLSGIPATADHLLVILRGRSDNVITNNQWLGLRLNGDAGPDTYDGNTLRFVSASAAGQAADGIDLEQWVLGDNTPSDVAAGIFSMHFALIPRYALAEAHMLLSLGFGRIDDVNTSDANFATYLSGAQHVPAVLAAVSSLVLVPQSGNLAAGSSITVIGLLASGDAAVIRRSAQVGTVLDFAGDEFKDATLAPGVNTFTATNPRLGRTISVRVSGGDGTSSIVLPAGTELVANTYVAGQAGWVVLRCTDEAGPAFLAQVRDIA